MPVFNRRVCSQQRAGRERPKATAIEIESGRFAICDLATLAQQGEHASRRLGTLLLLGGNYPVWGCRSFRVLQSPEIHDPSTGIPKAQVGDEHQEFESVPRAASRTDESSAPFVIEPKSVLSSAGWTRPMLVAQERLSDPVRQ